jgi:RNA polymerase sigma-70 factor (ECF subfamily)
LVVESSMAIGGEQIRPAPPMVGGSDGELARQVAQGDRDAAETLVRRHQAVVRSFLLRLTGRRDLADDLAQDTFLRALRHADRFDDQHAMRTWLLTIARRLLINHVRRADQRVRTTDYAGEVSRQGGPDEQAQRADQQAWMRSRLERAMEKLTEPQRAALVLFHQQGLPLREVAKVMDLPEGTVKSHLHRARATLRQLLPDPQAKE